MTENTQRKCIYCLKLSVIRDFNSEHVLQKSMTNKQSIQGNLTLEPTKYQNCVCEDCNKHFGRTLDLVFGRDSLEGILRYKHNVKPLSDLKDQRYNRTKFRTPSKAPCDPGAELIFCDDGQKDMVGRTTSQVRIRNKDTGNFEYFAEEKLSALVLRALEFDFSSLELHGSSKMQTENWSAFKDNVLTVLKQLGIEQYAFGAITELLPGVSNPITEISLEKDLQQALSKIAFNYLAVILSRLDESLIVNGAFDEMRNFIRYGTEPRFECVSVVDEVPISESLHMRMIFGRLGASIWPANRIVFGHRIAFNFGRVGALIWPANRMFLAT